MSADITQLCEELQPIAREFLAQCASQKLNTKILVTYRSGSDQDKAKAAGLSNACAGESPHNVCDASGNPASCAFDFGIFDNGTYITNGSDNRYRQAGAIGKKLGLIWGGDFKSIFDPDHLELPHWKYNLLDNQDAKIEDINNILIP